MPLGIKNDKLLHPSGSCRYVAPLEALIYLARFWLAKVSKACGAGLVPAPFRGALTLCDLENMPSSCPQPPCLRKGSMLGCPVGCCAAGPGGIGRALAKGAIRAGLWVLAVRKYTIYLGCLISELMQTLQRGESSRPESVRGFCRHRSTFSVLEGGGGDRAVESAPLIFFLLFFFFLVA